MADDIELLLQSYATDIEREKEVERVLSAFKYNPYDILGVDISVLSEKELKVLYRKKSLLVHPDKCKHPRAQEAFAALSKANTELQDEARRAYLTSLADDARAAVMKERKLREGDEELTAPDFMPAVRKQVRRIIAENELRRREVLKRDLEEDARQKRTSDESVAELKKKQEDAKVWETGRDERVSDWRSFQAKKARTNGDFRPPKVTAEDPSKSFVRRVVPK